MLNLKFEQQTLKTEIIDLQQPLDLCINGFKSNDIHLETGLQPR